MWRLCLQFDAAKVSRCLAHEDYSPYVPSVSHVTDEPFASVHVRRIDRLRYLCVGSMKNAMSRILGEFATWRRGDARDATSWGISKGYFAAVRVAFGCSFSFQS